MSTARNGAVEIYYEEFGDPASPTLLLVNGLGSQCLNYDVSWCQLFCDEGFHVVWFDNRDVGLSTNFLVIQYQSYLAQARSTEVAALDAYAKAKVQYERSAGSTLTNYNVSIDEALKGVVQRTSLPTVPPAAPAAVK